MRKIVSALMAGLVSAIFILSADADGSCLRDYDSGRKDRILDAEKFINGFLAAVRAVASLDDATSWSARSQAIQRVAEFIDFPLQRMYPLPPIHSTRELAARYSEVFDDNLVQIVTDVDGYDTCSYHPVYGCVLQVETGQGCQEPGCIRFGYGSAIIRIDEHSEAEMRERERLIAADKRNLHEKLREFKYPVLDWETCAYRVRVDYLGDERYRYASWYVGERYDAEPDLVIDDGEVASGDGSIVPLYFYFSGGQYKYMLDIGF